MEGVRQAVLGGAYIEEPRRSRLNIEEYMAVTAMGTHRRCQWTPRSTSGPAFMVSKATDATVWNVLK